ncbi:MAG: DUF128 domain-containing protein, partial [Methanomicrobiales archaeon]|nr:DUF128 domain-containing protein [Methanomicrobiales archaeon]
MHRPLQFVNHRIEEYALKVTYKPEEDTGDIIYNISLIREDDFDALIAVLRQACHAGLCVSNRLRVAYAGETAGGMTIP